MDLFKVLGIGIVAAALSVLLRHYRPELAIAVPIMATVVIFSLLSPYLVSVLSMFEDIAEQVGIDLQYVVIVIKIIGVAYIAQFGAELCRDAGESATASKIEFGGKILIVTMSMPIVYRLLHLVSSIVNF